MIRPFIVKVSVLGYFPLCMHIYFPNIEYIRWKDIQKLHVSYSNINV